MFALLTFKTAHYFAFALSFSSHGLCDEIAGEQRAENPSWSIVMGILSLLKDIVALLVLFWCRTGKIPSIWATGFIWVYLLEFVPIIKQGS